MNPPDHPALGHRDIWLTYAELDARVDAAAGGLAASSVGPGDVVACSLPNRIALVEAFLATQRLGAVWLGVNANLADDEMAWQLDDARTALLVTTPERAATLPQPPGGRPILMVDPSNGSGSWSDLVDAGHPAPATSIDPHAPAAIAYTSGTTGRPKGAVHSQHNLLWPGISSRRSYPAVPDERHGAALALTILNMLVLGPLWAFLRGTSAYLMDHTDAVGVASEVRTRRISRLTLVPAMAHDLVAHPDVTCDDLASLTQTIIGAGHSPPPLRNAWAEKFGTRAIVGYGLTEAPDRGYPRARRQADATRRCRLSARTGPGGDRRRGRPSGARRRYRRGVPRPHHRRSVGRGGGRPCSAPLGRPEATAEALRGGVLHTGDLGFIDEDGQLVIRGRRTEMILRGGGQRLPGGGRAGDGRPPGCPRSGRLRHTRRAAR
ncbi:MAG: hypothetical protein Ct9H300mP12_08640 [Acidimicrobiales bacterium]|nr:MAG: hypothetical protein Ct9H300mP12_08640 [Acidimicrobiales bacterium]